MQALRRAAPRASKSTTRRTPRASKPSKPSKPPQRPTARRTNLSDFKQRHQLLRNRIRAQRTARREDWTLGPLAPRRDAGEGKETYGTVGLRELQGAEGQKGKRKGEAKKDGELIWVGDRVVVVGEKGPEGRERGRIGTVTEVKREQGECVVEEMNLVSEIVLACLVFSGFPALCLRDMRAWFWRASLIEADGGKRDGNASLATTTHFYHSKIQFISQRLINPSPPRSTSAPQPTYKKWSPTNPSSAPSPCPSLSPQSASSTPSPIPSQRQKPTPSSTP